MRPTNYDSIAKLIKKDGKEISIDGIFKENVDLDRESLEVTFVFQKNSGNLSELKSLAKGGSIAPIYEMSIDEVKFCVFAMGAVQDSDTEISCFIQKKDA